MKYKTCALLRLMNNSSRLSPRLIAFQIRHSLFHLPQNLITHHLLDDSFFLLILSLPTTCYLRRLPAATARSCKATCVPVELGKVLRGSSDQR